MVEHRIFELGDVQLQKGGSIPNAKLGYALLGEMNAAKDNIVLCPTWFSGTPSDVASVMTGPGRALDPEKHCIVIPNHFGGSVSSSPSNCSAPFDRSRFPHVTNYDNVAAQHRLLTEEDAREVEEPGVGGQLEDVAEPGGACREIVGVIEVAHDRGVRIRRPSGLRVAASPLLEHVVADAAKTRGLRDVEHVSHDHVAVFLPLLGELVLHDRDFYCRTRKAQEHATGDRR